MRQVISKLHQKLKSRFFKFFSSVCREGSPSGPLQPKKNQKPLILAFEANISVPSRKLHFFSGLLRLLCDHDELERLDNRFMNASQPLDDWRKSKISSDIS